MDDFREKIKKIKEKIKEEEKREKKKAEENDRGAEPSRIVPKDDLELFQSEMQGVRRLSYKSIVPKKNQIRRRYLYDPDGEVVNTLKLLIDEKIEFTISDTADYIEGYIKDIDPNLLRSLKRGEFSVESVLDLHGTTREEAKRMVKNFIEKARLNSFRCISIIHGKGYHSKDHIPVLKESLKDWLSSRSIGRHILAFCSAMPKDGGTGAIYVLLKKR